MNRIFRNVEGKTKRPVDPDRDLAASKRKCMQAKLAMIAACAHAAGHPLPSGTSDGDAAP